MKYLVYIDYKATAGVKYLELAARNVKDAIKEVNNIWELLGDKIFLTDILQKVGKVIAEGGYKSEDYSPILRNRGGKEWFDYNDEDHFVDWKVRRWWSSKDKDYRFYELV